MSNNMLCNILLIILYSWPSLSVRVNHITIAGGEDYLHLQKSPEATIQCNYETEGEDKVTEVTWSHNGFPLYIWSAQNPPIISESFTEEDIAKSTADPHLHIKKLNMDFSGTYNCDVRLETGVSSSSYTFQLLIVDLPDHAVQSESSISDCKLKFSWKTPAINPKPSPLCGVWSEKHGYTRSATSWLATPYYNGSISYRLQDEIFDVTHMPLDSVIKCELSITKIDRTKIELISNTYNFKEISERGCLGHPLDVGENVVVEYDNLVHTCHNEFKPKNPVIPAVEKRTCKKGFEPKYKDFVTMVELLCDGKEWKVGGGQSWDHVSNLICIPEEVYKEPIIPPPPPPIERKRAENFSDGSTSGVAFMSPWAFIILTCVVVSGVLCSAKLLPKKKPSRLIE